MNLIILKILVVFLLIFTHSIYSQDEGSLGFIEEMNGYQGSLELGSKSKSIGLGVSTLYYDHNHWSSFSNWIIGLGSTLSIDPEYQNASVFRIGIGTGMMKSITHNSKWFQVWELLLMPGYESWRNLSSDQSKSAWTIGLYVNPRLSCFFTKNLLIGLGPSGDYHYNSTLNAYNYGGKISVAFYQ